MEVELGQPAIARSAWLELEIEGDLDAFQYMAVGQDCLQDIAQIRSREFCVVVVDTEKVQSQLSEVDKLRQRTNNLRFFE